MAHVIDGKRVLILGSGFSKAIFPDSMPTVTDLAPLLLQEDALNAPPYDRFADNPELLLSYLALNQPWKEPSDGLSDQGLFVQVQQALAEHIAKCEGQAFENPTPDWVDRLIEHLHDDRTSVITLNYDTVLERFVHGLKEGKPDGTWPREYHLYDLPLSILRLRSAGTLGGTEVASFHLIKLHGSINWFYSGVEGFPGEQIYYRAVTSDSPARDDWGRLSSTDKQIKRLCQDKIPLIIPPVAEKSRFYENRTIRMLWTAAREALTEAEEVMCVGYSLPETDLTMKLFLRAVARPKKVVIVNKEHLADKNGQEMLKRYQEAFPGAEVDGGTFMCKDSVQKMTEYLVA